MPKNVKNLLDKARESALLAVDVYNKPKTSFRSGGFIILMHIAWTSLLHAVFEKQRIKYFYKSKSKKRYAKIDGDYKAWDLNTSIQQFIDIETDPMRKNLEFFIKLRNKIEHRFMPEIDSYILGKVKPMY